MHTKTPWRTETVSDAVRVVVGEGRAKVILARLCPKQITEEETFQNAKIIVLAVNSHARVVAALEDLLSRHASQCGCSDPGEELCPGIAEANAALRDSKE